MNINLPSGSVLGARQQTKTPDSMYSYCRIIGCHHPATAGTESGLNRRYCRKHEDHYERHGSYTKPSYRRTTIEPHRRAALRWLKANRDSPAIRQSIAAVQRIYRQSGPKIEAFRLRGLKPEARAWAAWARLREGNVDPIRPLAACLAIQATIASDPQPDLSTEYRLVQVAKLVHRMASGSHKRWERVRPNGSISVEELHHYPHSRGRVLRHIGRQLQKIAETVSEVYLIEALDQRDSSGRFVGIAKSSEPM